MFALCKENLSLWVSASSALLLLSFPLLAAKDVVPSAVTIEEAFKSALDRSELVAESREQVTQADVQVDQGIGKVLPGLSFNLTHLIQPSPADEIARQFSPPHQTTMNFSVTQPIFHGLSEFSGLSALKHGRSSKIASEMGVKSQLFQDLAANYLAILSVEQDLKNVQDQLSVYDKRVGELRARAGRGESNNSEVISAEATHASLSAELRLLEGQLENGRETFHYLTGLDRAARLKDPDVIGNTGGPANLEKYIERVEIRPDVKAAMERFEVAREHVTVAWAGHSPTVDAVGNYYLMRPGFLRDLKWDVGIRLVVPLFEGGATQAKVSEAISRRKEAELALQRTRRAASQQIRSIHQRLTARLDHMTRLRKSAELSKKNTQILERDYRRGLTRNIDVQLALAEYRMAQRSFDQSRFTSQLDMYQLQAAAALAPVVTLPKED